MRQCGRSFNPGLHRKRSARSLTEPICSFNENCCPFGWVDYAPCTNNISLNMLVVMQPSGSKIHRISFWFYIATAVGSRERQADWTDRSGSPLVRKLPKTRDGVIWREHWEHVNQIVRYLSGFVFLFANWRGRQLAPVSYCRRFVFANQSLDCNVA